MPLPIIPVPKDVVTFGEQEIPVRGMTRAEALMINGIIERTPEEADHHVLSIGAGVSVSDAKEWLDAASLDVGLEVLTRILELSGMADESPKDLKNPSTDNPEMETAA